MSSGQHADDGPYRSLKKWEDLAERRIREAQEDGAFDDLPGSGQPLELDDNPLAGEMQVGYRLLKNAGFAPEWMELDKEIRAEVEALRELRERAARRVAEVATGEASEPAQVGEHRGLVRRWLGWLVRAQERRGEAERLTRTDAVVAERERARAAYLERASRLTERVARFNAVRPRDAWSLERLVPTPQDHEREFDAACPPLVDQGGLENRQG